MSLILSGTDGLSDVDGSAATPAIRGTDANTGIFFPAADTIAFAEGGVEAMRLDSSGNLGLGVTPSSWDTLLKAITVTNTAVFSGQTNAEGMRLGSNWYYNSGFKYQTTGSASRYDQASGAHIWYQAGSGTAGNAITFTQAMTLDASSRLLIGLTSSLNGNGAVQAGGFSDTRVVIDGSSTQGIFFTKSGADNGTYRVDASGNYNWFVKGAGTANMTLDVSGNLLVGTSSINKLGSGAAGPGFQIATSGGAEIYLSTSATASGEFVGAINFGTTGTSSAVKRSALIGSLLTATSSSVVSGNLLFYTTNAGTLAEAMRIDSSGNLLVGTTSTNSSRLNVIKGDATGAVIRAESTSGSYTGNLFEVYGGRTTTNGSYNLIAVLNGNASGQFKVLDSGNAQNTNNSYGAISDVKLKENIVDATPKLERLNQVRVVNYNLIGSEQKQLGVIAQELEQIFPGMVEETADKDMEGNDLGTTTKAVKYSVFVPMLIKAIQEQQALITTLTARITALENK